MKLEGEKLNTWIKRYGLTRESWDKYRARGKTDLFFLAKTLGYFDITEGTHREVCDFFVKKEVDGKPAGDVYPQFREFAVADTDLHRRDLLLPRGGFKSSLRNADCVQWILNWPNITQLILTGTFALARDFVREIREFFTFTVDGEGKDATLIPRILPNGKPSLFQVLFPEFCVGPGEGTQLEYACPLKTFGKEPNIRAASINQALSGFHYDIMKLDDVVHNENCKTPERREEVRRQVSLAGEMLNPYGYFDKIGTWYDEDDVYGHEILEEERRARNGESSTVKILLRPAMWPKPGLEGKPEEQMQEEDWVLWFPERLPYSLLMQEKARDPKNFGSQKMNNPRLYNSVKFPKEELIKATLPMPSIPVAGAIFIAWDTAYKTNSWNDYTVGLVGLFSEGKIYVIDMVRGRYGPFELPRVIASCMHRWQAARSVIEDTNGVGLLEREVWRELRMLGSAAPLELAPLGKGQKGLNDKVSKAKLAARLLFSGRLFFSTGCPGLEDIYEELGRFGTGRGHDDIACALSLLVNRFAGSLEAQIAESEAVIKARNATMRNWYDRIYPTNAYDNIEAGFMFTEGPQAPRADSTGLPPLLGDLEF